MLTKNEKWETATIRSLLIDEFPGEWGIEPADFAGNTKVLRSTNLDDYGHIEYEEGAERNVSHVKRSQKQLKVGDILVEASGGGPNKPVGRVTIFAPPDNRVYLTSNFFRTLRPTTIINPKFLLWKLLHIYISPRIWSFQQQTTGIINLNVSEYLNQTIEYPALNKQCRIAEILDTADAAIRQTETLIVKLKQIKAGLLQDLLTHGLDDQGQIRDSVVQPKLVPISDLIEVNPLTSISGLDTNTEVSFIPMADVKDTGEWCNRQVKRLKEIKSGYTSFKENDILFAKITPCMENGKGMHATELTNGIGFGSTEFPVLRTKSTTSARFIYYWTQTESLRRRAEAMMMGSAGQQRVPAEFFDKFEVPLLELEEQVQIATFIDDHDRLIRIEEATRDKLRQLKQGLMADLLTGRVPVSETRAGV